MKAARSALGWRTARRVIPTATVNIQMATLKGTRATRAGTRARQPSPATRCGRRRVRQRPAPTAAPARNGRAVSTTPRTVMSCGGSPDRRAANSAIITTSTTAVTNSGSCGVGPGWRVFTRWSSPSHRSGLCACRGAQTPHRGYVTGIGATAPTEFDHVSELLEQRLQRRRARRGPRRRGYRRHRARRGCAGTH